MQKHERQITDNLVYLCISLGFTSLSFTCDLLSFPTSECVK